ncbi:MAG: helix-turn-helix domain-containing protein, partial [Clostridia bacterium]|nr:helix-turn-helix domain-containing protein [Clostridia bacterium]
MNQYITGSAIKARREELKITQSEFAQLLGVSDKTVSKWETGRGYPDITLLQPIAKTLKTSLVELLSGEKIANSNLSYNMLRMKFYICPVCGNIITAAGEAQINCCGINLIPAEEENCDIIETEKIEDETYITVNHPMTKEHYISFIAVVGTDGFSLKKLYPEGACEARFRLRGHGKIYCYCNHHGMS